MTCASCARASRQVIEAALLLQYLKAQIAGLLAAFGGELLQHLDGLILAGRKHVDMRQHINRAVARIGLGAEGRAGNL
jgi:hypothetical protein